MVLVVVLALAVAVVAVVAVVLVAVLGTLSIPPLFLYYACVDILLGAYRSSMVLYALAACVSFNL